MLVGTIHAGAVGHCARAEVLLIASGLAAPQIISSMKLPRGKNAVVDIAKLRDYCLNAAHPRGRHKARVFASVLGFTAADADLLRHKLLNAAIEDQAVAGERDDYGQRYVLDFEVSGPKRKAIVRSIWIILHTEGIPRMISCYVL